MWFLGYKNRVPEMAFDGGRVRKKILLKGPLLTRSGYGEQARFALRTLRSREDLFDIYIQPLQWGQTSWINESSTERNWIDQTIEDIDVIKEFGLYYQIDFETAELNKFLLKMKFLIDKDIKNGILK